MTRNVGERWEEYLRLGRRMSPHTVAAYLGDFHSLMEFLSLRADATP
ncbi:MAG: site-specific integrase, partial [Actinomyces sp.]|nr:site-specific integrase [Actinomyces sp.]